MVDALTNREIRNRVYVTPNSDFVKDADGLATTALFSPVTINSHAHGYFRIYACFSTSGILTASVAYNGGTAYQENLNGGVALTAGAAYLFDIPAFSNETITFRYSGTSGKVYRFVVDEYSG